MKWHKGQEPTPERRVFANELFNQAYASRVVPLGTGNAMTYIDVHTEHSQTEKDGPVYRVFRNGAIDIGTPEMPDPVIPERDATSVEYFVTMSVEIHVGIARVEKRHFHDTMYAPPGDLMENLYWRAWAAMAREHHFDSHTGLVVAWNAIRNEIQQNH